MAKSFLLKAGGSAAAMMLMSAVLAPQSAYAQSAYECEGEVELYDEISDMYYFDFIPLTECGEIATDTYMVGSKLLSLSDSFTQQQLSFGGIGGFGGPTGRLRTTRHDGLKEKTTGQRTAAFETDEGSVFANGSYDLPGTYFGGKVRIAGLVGYDRMEQNSDIAGLFSSDIDSVVYGGSYLWSSGSFYTMSLIIGLSGEATGSNIGGTYSYDVNGYVTNSVMGNTFDLGSVKFDVRGNLGRYDVRGDRVVIPGTLSTVKGTAEAWNAGLTGTLFTLINLDGGGLMRPYILGAYKHVFDEDIKVTGAAFAEFEQANNYGRAELGFDYVQGALTYGAAAYTEFSADENTFGGRLGVSVKLQ